MKGKIQKNESGNFILVQADNSTNTHFGPGFQAEIEPMTDDQIREEFNKRMPVIPLQMMKNYLKSVDGFCISNVAAKDKSYSHGSMFRFQEKDQ